MASASLAKVIPKRKRSRRRNHRCVAVMAMVCCGWLIVVSILPWNPYAIMFPMFQGAHDAFFLNEDNLDIRIPPSSLPETRNTTISCHGEGDEYWASFYVQYLEELERRFQKTSCRRHPHTNGTINLGAGYCATVSAREYTAFNPLSAARYLCGQLIPPEQMAILSDHCPQASGFLLLEITFVGQSWTGCTTHQSKVRERASN